MSSYAKLFLDSIIKKAKGKKKRKSSFDHDQQQKEDSLSKSNNKLDIDKVYDWKAVEERYIFNNRICPAVDEQRDYVEITHDEDNNNEDNTNMTILTKAYNSPLNEIIPLSRFTIEDENEFIKEFEEKALPSQLNKEENKDKDIKDDKEYDEEQFIRRRRERAKYNEENPKKEDEFDNELNVTEDQMKDMQIEVKKIQNEYDKQQQLIALKREKRIFAPQEDRAVLFEKRKKYNPRKLINLKQSNQMKEIEKNNNVVVNNTNQYIFSNYANTNGIPMIPHPYQKPLPMPLPLSLPIPMNINNPLPFQMQMDSNYPNGFNYQYPQPQSLYFNPDFPTELPYIPTIHKPPIKAKRKEKNAINKDNTTSQANFIQRIYEPLSNDLSNTIEKPSSKKVVGYKPKSIKEYKDKYEGKKTKNYVGGLGPNIGTQEWNEKHQRAIKQKDYSQIVNLTLKSNNNIKIIHQDNRLNKKIKSSNKEKKEESQDKHTSFQEKDSLNKSGSNNESIELPINNDLNNNDYKDNNKLNNIKEVNKEHCNTQESKNKTKVSSIKKQPTVTLPVIIKRKPRTSSHIYHKSKLKANNTNDGEIQFNNEDLNKLYHNHNALLSQVDNIKLSVYKK